MTDKAIWPTVKISSPLDNWLTTIWPTLLRLSVKCRIILTVGQNYEVFALVWAFHSWLQICPVPSGSKVIALQSFSISFCHLSKFLQSTLVGWLQEGRAGFCRRPLALPQLPTPSRQCQRLIPLEAILLGSSKVHAKCHPGFYNAWHTLKLLSLPPPHS